MSIARLLALTMLVFTPVLNAVIATAQPFPTKPIRMATTEPGGGNDFIARLMAPWLTASLGQQIIIDNRATPIVAAELVAKAPPDGHSLLFASGNLWIGALMQKMPYDAIRDFAPITSMTSAPNILVVHPSLPVGSVKELIALAKARSGELNYASAATGSSSHLAAELFESMAGVKMVRVPYKGGGPALIPLLAGEVQIMFSTTSPVVAYVKSGKLRGLAVTSAQPSELLPGLPTVAASGLPGYEMVGITVMFAPAKTPSAIINRLNQEIVQVLNRTDMREKLLNNGSEVIGSSPEQLAATIKSEIALWTKVIKEAGLRIE